MLLNDEAVWFGGPPTTSATIGVSAPTRPVSLHAKVATHGRFGGPGAGQHLYEPRTMAMGATLKPKTRDLFNSLQGSTTGRHKWPTNHVIRA